MRKITLDWKNNDEYRGKTNYEKTRCSGRLEKVVWVKLTLNPSEGLPVAHGRIAEEATACAATRCAAMEEGSYEYFPPSKRLDLKKSEKRDGEDIGQCHSLSRA